MMKMAYLFRLVLIVLVGAVVCTSPLSAQNQKMNYVILAKGQGTGSTSFAKSLGPALVSNLEKIGVVTATSSDPGFAAWALAMSGVQAVAQDPEIQWLPKEVTLRLNVKQAGPHTVKAEAVNAEPFNGYLWNLHAIHADVTAAAGDMGAGARVAVLDSGMDLKNPDLVPNINQKLAVSYVPGEVVQPQCAAPCFNHGTHVGGIIAAAINGLGVQGVAPHAELVPVKVLRESGSGSFSWMITGIEYAASIKADVINMSLGATFDLAQAGKDNQGLGTLLSALNRAVNHATAAGTLLVSSAGNEGLNLNSSIVSIPAQSGNGIAISATGPYCQADFDRFASYSNYGQSVINLAAPGGGVECPLDTWYLDLVLSDSVGDYYFAAGTSMAAPHVSGTAALIVGKFGHIGPAAIKSLLQQTADDLYMPGSDPYSGNGRVNAQRALGD
jgi:lantibiotic leader peptide-processing serine protease